MSCDNLIGTKVMQVIHLVFVFKENVAIERKIPTESGVMLDNAITVCQNKTHCLGCIHIFFLIKPREKNGFNKNF